MGKCLIAQAAPPRWPRATAPALHAGHGSEPELADLDGPALCAIKVALVLTLWIRFGVLTDLTGKLVFLLALRYPLSLDFSAWYSGTTVFVILAILGLAVYGFVTATAGRPWLRERLMDG